MRLAGARRGHLRGGRVGEAASRARLAVCAGFQHWTAPSGRAGRQQRGAGPSGGGPGSARLGLPLGLGGGGAETGDCWSCAQHSGCRLYMGRKLEEIRWSPSNGTVQRSNPSNVPQDNRSAHVPLNRRWWGQARRREQWAGRRGVSEGEEGAEVETEKEVCMEWGEERGDSRRKTERDMQRKRHTHTERGRNRNRETKRRTKRHKKSRGKAERSSNVRSHTHRRQREIQTHKKKAPQRCKERKRKVQDRGRS